MFSQEAIQIFIDWLVMFATDFLMSFMVVVFIVALCMRWLIYFTLRRQEQFVMEFDKRVKKYVDESELEPSYFLATKTLLVRTYYEFFVKAAMLKRRKSDPVMTLTDRMFLIRSGFAWLVRDVLRQLKHLKHDGSQHHIHQLSKNVFQQNPFFNNVFGKIPSRITTDLLNILPGMFIIGGIFGTFLGIMKALPDLSGMNLQDIEASKAVIDQFLLRISFSMSTSLIGILLSVLTTIWNSIFSAQKVFVRTVERFENTLNVMWAASEHNEVPKQALDFDEHKDPLDALAQTALEKDIEKVERAS